MTFKVIAVFVSTLLLSVASAAQTDSLTIRFIGNAAFELNDGTTVLVTDFPYRSGAYGYMTYPDHAAPEAADASIVTHGHTDHFDAALFGPTGWRLIAPRDVLAAVDPSRAVGGNGPWTIGAFKVHAVATPHADVDHFSYVIEWRGRRMFFSGDTEEPEAVLETADLDFAFLTPWLLCTIVDGGFERVADRIVLYHHFPGNRSRVCGAPEVFNQGASFVLTPALHQEDNR